MTPGDIVLLVVAFAVILFGAELFTNGIEWFGHRHGLGDGAVGSVLAAVGTALPETMIPLIAILVAGGSAGTDIGIGAILGAPFMLATLAMFVTGLAALLMAARRPSGSRMAVDPAVLVQDLRVFAAMYIPAIGVAFLPADLLWPRWAVAAALVAGYAWYVRGHLRADAPDREPDLLPLRFRRLDRRGDDHPDSPGLHAIQAQLAVSLVAIVGGAYLFVGAVDRLASGLGLDDVLLALVIAPIATELPEKLNSVLWVRQGKDTLALGNITGAMVFQSAIPTSVALVFAAGSWAVGPESRIAFLSAGVALVSTAFIFGPSLRRGALDARSLLIGGAFYLVELGAVVLTMAAH